MDAADTFIAAIPEPYRILGLRLKSFCLGHYFLMRRFKVAFVSDSHVSASIEDLILGVLICSMNYEGFQEFLEQDDCNEQIKTWGSSIGLSFDLSDKVQLMNRYLEYAFKQPTVLYKGDTSKSGAHWADSLKCALLDMGLNLSEAMNLPLSEAFKMFYKRAEDNGVVEIASPELATALKGEDGQN